MNNGLGGSQLVAVNKIDTKGTLPKAVTNAMAIRAPVQWQQQFLRACRGLTATGDIGSSDLEIGAIDALPSPAAEGPRRSVDGSALVTGMFRAIVG